MSEVVDQLPSLEDEETMFNMADIAVFVLFVGGIIAFYLYKTWEENNKVSIKPISLQQIKTGIVESGLDVVERMNKTNKRMVVFYGSQTGTAEEFSMRLAKEARYYGIPAMCADPMEYDVDTLKNLCDVEGHLAVFVLATYGEGDPTDNAVTFDQFIRNEDTDLTGLNFSVFGLGNSTYEHYNKMGKDVDVCLEKAGGVRISALGLGDDDSNIEEDYMGWKEQFWTDVCKIYGVEKSEDNLDLRNYKLALHEKIHKSKVYKGEMGYLNSYQNQRPPFDTKNPFKAPLRVNYNLCSEDSDRVVFHCEVDISKAKIKYDPGDHIAVYPENNHELVEKLGQRLDVDLDQVMSLDSTDEFSNKKHPFPCPTTYRTALTHYIDITTPPRTNLLKDLAPYATDPTEKEFLVKISSNSIEGKNQYNDWVVKDQRHIIHILEDMPSLAPPIDHVLELLPRLQCRYYSIASSPKANPRSIHICAALVKYKTSTGRPAEGVCTSWLANMIPSETEEYHLPVYVRRNQSFRLPRKASIPIIMIGPGTGYAPFRAFIQHRAAIIKEGKECGENVLFFGCRHSNQDYLYKDELKEYQAEGTITLFEAFSRDTDKKFYVQNSMDENSMLIWSLLEKGAHVYVCGDARRMARDVHATLLTIIQDYGKMELRDAENYIISLENAFRYQKDVWS